MQQQLDTTIKRLIQEEVKAQIKRYAMAKRRDDFINGLEDVLSPALSHHYRATLATINHRTDQLEEWRRQEEGFLDQFTEQLLRPTKAKGLDVEKAVEQALKELLEKDAARRRGETAKFQKTYGLKKVVPLPENVYDVFVDRVRELVILLLAE